MSDLVTAEYRADLVLLLVDKKPVFAIVVEVQLGIDRDKSYRWLSYVATVRDRWRCPVTLLVVTPDENVAEWARQPIEFSGPGSVFVPLVLGPADIPVIRRGQPTTPEAAVLSALAHARDPGNLEAITVAVEQLASLDEATRLFYYDLVVSRLDEATRIALEALMQTPGYEYQSEFARRYKAEGKAEGEAKAARAMLLELLIDREFVLTDEQRQRLESSTDADQLRSWFRRALRAASTTDVFGA
jgi:hypothetical protein